MATVKSPQLFYRDIVATVNAIKVLSTASSDPEVVPCVTPLYAPYHSFPAPLPILDSLIADGVPPSVAERLSSAFQSSVEMLRRRLESVFQDAWAKILKTPRHKAMMPVAELGDQLRKTHETLFSRKVNSWREEIRQRARARLSEHNVVQTRQSANRVSDDGRQTFNHQFVSVLETCFDKNPLPSKTDKLNLAQLSGMTYRQIHVWFQNHRSRTKKQAEAFQMSKAAFEKMGDFERLGRSRNATDKTFPRSFSVTLVEDDAFFTRAPSYAFPTAYSSELVLVEDPFPCRFGDLSYFGKPCWSRQPTSQARETIEPDISTLCLAFTGLHLGDAALPSLQKKSSRMRKRLQEPSKESGCDVTSPYTVRPLRAPLMSLIRNFASRVVHRSGKPSADVQSSQRKVASTPTVESGTQSGQCKTRRRQAPASRGSAVSTNQNSAPSACSPNEHISFSTPNSSVATACILIMDQPPKVKKSTRNSSSSQRVPAASTSKRTKGRSAPIVKVTEPSSEPLIVHPSPTASVDSLPSLSYSSESSSASTCSQSPTTSFGVLPDNDLLPSLDPYLPSGSSLTLPLAPTVFEGFPSQMFPPSDISFDFSKGPLDYTFDLGLPSYPSYSESFDSISQGLQSSPDFPPPGLSLDSFSFAV